MDLMKLKRLYGRLKGLRELTFVDKFINISVVEDYNNIVEEISKIVEEDMKSFLLQKYETSVSGRQVGSKDVQSKLLQLLSYLEYGFSLSEAVLEIGSIYNSIADEELKGRCSDILSSPGNFDRVINQATLVLEDRLRTKSKNNDGSVGVQLVNRVLNTDPSKSILKVSEHVEEHEGICHICRGIMLSFRNPTHHFVTDRFSREDALKLVAFIDNLLQIIDNSEVQS
jgi:hypothetical protein